MKTRVELAMHFKCIALKNRETVAITWVEISGGLRRCKNFYLKFIKHKCDNDKSSLSLGEYSLRRELLRKPIFLIVAKNN